VDRNLELHFLKGRLVEVFVRFHIACLNSEEFSALEKVRLTVIMLLHVFLKNLPAPADSSRAIEN